MTQPAIDQNTLLAEARQALEKLDRMKAERSRLDLEEKQLRRQLETEKKAAEDSVALTVKKRREESFLILSFRRFSLYKVTEPRRSRRHQFSNFSSPFSTSIRIGFSRSISPARIRFDRSLTM